MRHFQSFQTAKTNQQMSAINLDLSLLTIHVYGTVNRLHEIKSSLDRNFAV